MASAIFERVATRRPAPAVRAGCVDEPTTMPRDRSHLDREVALARRDGSPVPVHQRFDQAALAGARSSEQGDVDGAEHLPLPVRVEEVGRFGARCLQLLPESLDDLVCDRIAARISASSNGHPFQRGGRLVDAPLVVGDRSMALRNRTGNGALDYSDYRAYVYTRV